MKKIILTSLFALGLSGAALAQAAINTEFTAVDTDLNGTISYSEAVIAWPDLTEQAFAEADIDGSGELSPEEYEALLASLETPAG